MAQRHAGCVVQLNEPIYEGGRAGIRSGREDGKTAATFDYQTGMHLLEEQRLA